MILPLLEANAKNQNIDKIGFHIRQSLTTVANQKCGPENTRIDDLYHIIIDFML